MIIILHADTDAPYDILGALINALDLDTVHYIDNTGGVTINRCSSGTVTIHDANEVGDVRANAVRTIYNRFLSQTQTPHTGSLYGTEGFRRVGMEI
jgi:F420-0:gamma-glutamyl ligase-like protein